MKGGANHMETNRRHTGLWVTLTVLLAIALALLCWLAAGPQALTPASFRWGFYPLPAAAPYSSDRLTAVQMAGDGIITDRNAPVLADSVVYRYRGEDEVVLWRIRGLGRLVDFLSANSLSVWALCAAAAAVCAILWLTAPRRRVRRMQEQMKKTFAACGAKYDREDENEDY